MPKPTQPFRLTTVSEPLRSLHSTVKSDLQKPLTGPQTMLSRASLLLVLLLLVSAPLSVLAESTVEAPKVVASSTDDAVSYTHMTLPTKVTV